MPQLKQDSELLKLLNGSYEELCSLDASKVFNISEIEMNIADILEGIFDQFESQDGTKKLLKVQDLVGTLNPDFDDEDYEDPYAEIWEEFVNSLTDEKLEYIIVVY